MSELKKHAPALVAIAALALIRFIFLPVFDWQSTAIAEHKLLERKLNKARQLLENQQQLVEDKNRTVALVQKLTPLFYSERDVEAFKLSEQQNIESNMNSHDLRLRRIGWQTLYQLPESNIQKIDLEYNFEGDGSAVLQYLLELEKGQHFIHTPEFSLSFRGQREGRLGIISVFLRRSYYLLPDGVNTQ